MLMAEHGCMGLESRRETKHQVGSADTQLTLHLSTSDRIARIASTYFHNANVLLNSIKVIQDSLRDPRYRSLQCLQATIF
jgi:hypothetical protein